MTLQPRRGQEQLVENALAKAGVCFSGQTQTDGGILIHIEPMLATCAGGRGAPAKGEAVSGVTSDDAAR